MLSSISGNVYIFSIQAHIHNTNHTISFNNFLIISSCHSSSNFELLIQGSLFISLVIFQELAIMMIMMSIVTSIN